MEIELTVQAKEDLAYWTKTGNKATLKESVRYLKTFSKLHFLE
jgi:hypothetical protein